MAVSGPRAIAIVDSFLIPAGKTALSDLTARHIMFGHWGHAQGEEVVVASRDSRNVEIHCHGGHVAVEMIRGQLQEAGCEPVAWRDWPTACSADSIARAAQHALAGAVTERTALILLDQARGALHGEIERIRGELRQRKFAAAIDSLERLLARGKMGLHLTVPWRVVVAGAPNVGKSSLINAMVGYNRTIVFDRPGTTRDTVSVVTALDGWPVELTDTAGLRTACDPVESAGIAAARRAVAGADLTVLVFDTSTPWTADAGQLAKAWPDALIVLNKCDLEAMSEGAPDAVARTSAVTRTGIDTLIGRIVELLVDIDIEPLMPVPFTRAHIVALRAARDAASQDDPCSAVNALARVVS